MLVGSRDRTHQTLAPRLVVRLRYISHDSEDDIVGMDNAPKRMAAGLKLLAASSLIVDLLCLQVTMTRSSEVNTVTV